MKPRKIDTKYWQEILSDKNVAKEALVNLDVNGSKVKFVHLENGNQIPVKDITPEQAHEFMSKLCPDWAKS